MGRSERVSYWRGKQSTMPSDVLTGRLLFAEDTGNVYLDYLDYTNGNLVRAQLTDARKMDIAGGTFTGPVILVGDPQENLEPATKQYVDKVDTALTNHKNNEIIHIVEEERVKWNAKVDSVEFNANYDAGYNLGTISINGADYTIYAPITVDITGNARTATKLQTGRHIDGVLFDGTDDIVHYAQCNTAGDVNLKQVTIPDFELGNGSALSIYFTNTNTASNVRLKINDELDLPINFHREQVTGEDLKAGVYHLVYTGLGYEITGGPLVKYNDATSTQAGLMSSEDKAAFDTMSANYPAMKAKLDGIEDGANNYVLPTATDEDLGGVKIGTGIFFDSDGTISIGAEQIEEALGYTPAATEGSLQVFSGATETEDGMDGLVPFPYAGQQDSFLKGDGTWQELENSKPFEGAEELVTEWGQNPITGDWGEQYVSGHDGTMGLVPAPLATEAKKFLRGDGTWQTVNVDDTSDISQLIIEALQDEDIVNQIFSDETVVNNIVDAASTPISIERIREICVISPSDNPQSAMYMPAITNAQIDEICDE